MKGNGQIVGEKALAQALAALLVGGQLSPQKVGKLARSGKKTGKRHKMSEDDLKLAASANEQQAIQECNKRGYANPQPRVNILTAKAWLAKGFSPKKGEKAIRVGKGIPLFHEAQVVPLAPSSDETH